MAQSERSSAVTAAMDLATLGAVAQNFKKKSKRWLYDIAIPPKTRVPLPIERSPALYLSAGTPFFPSQNKSIERIAIHHVSKLSTPNPSRNAVSRLSQLRDLLET